jgi:catechol 2,3-dioxygenase-like lactoylglutathione lyase family enzyme
MFAHLKHVAIISENYALASKFYESMFAMKTSPNARPQRAVTVGDGYVGLNINPRYAGRPARLDHFGLQVADVETAFERMRQAYPQIEWLRRPGNRPFAGITTHDPDGNVFDLSQAEMGNRRDMYVENDRIGARHVDHVALRTLHPAAIATFYRDVFELEERPRDAGDPNHYLCDGHVTLVIMPWHITDYDGTGIVSPAPDHLGFAVEDLAAFQADLERLAGDNPYIAPKPLSSGSEGRARLELSKRSCPLCQFHFSDVDGILLSAAER